MTQPTTISVSMTRFCDFVATDPLGQFSKVKEIRRQYEAPYRPGGDYWSRWREGAAEVHRQGGARADIEALGTNAKDNRGDQYTSASAGYCQFWGRKRLDLLAEPQRATWVHDELEVRVNPEWLLEINGTSTVVKLHLKEKLRLNQRLANPLLYLLDEHFGSGVGDRTVGIIDVHRGKLWKPTSPSTGMDAVLRMQAAAFIAGWRALDAAPGAA